MLKLSPANSAIVKQKTSIKRSSTTASLSVRAFRRTFWFAYLRYREFSKTSPVPKPRGHQDSQDASRTCNRLEPLQQAHGCFEGHNSERSHAACMSDGRGVYPGIGRSPRPLPLRCRLTFARRSPRLGSEELVKQRIERAFRQYIVFQP